MKRSAISRKSPLKRGTTPMKKVNRKRRVSEFARCYGSKARVVWVKTQPCIICRGAYGHAENVHVVGGGTGRKSGFALIVPMCRRGHQQLHDLGRKTFEEIFKIDLALAAANTEQRWQAHVSARSRDSRRQSA